MKQRLMLALLMVVSGCAVVPPNRRAKLADPIMQFDRDPLEAYKKSKLQTTRGGAAGGDGTPAGGGCSCQ